MLVAIDVNDAPVENAEAPVFTFQKQNHWNTLLIPDVDFFHSYGYLHPQYRDDIPYRKKLSKAIFAGSTTGGRTITAEDVRKLSLPRLRAGVFFKGSRLVDFRIPRIIQCESPAVVEMIAALGINSSPCSWRDQFGHRMILSMDGNGATCSRIVIGLMSQSALVKYDSPNRLYYFSAMEPWRHFVPVADDEDVISMVEAERRHPAVFGRVADEGRVFAQKYLSRAGTHLYMAKLLRLYNSNLSSAPPRRRPRQQAPGDHHLSVELLPVIKLAAHIQDVGDISGWPGDWIGEIGSRRVVEAITLLPTGVPSEAVRMQVVLEDGVLSPAVNIGNYHGSRGENKPLFGFRIELNGNWAETLECRYSARFTDGSSCGPLAQGAICRSPAGAPLEAFKISIVGRSPAAPDTPHRAPALAQELVEEAATYS